MVAPVVLAVVAFIAGHPTQVACDADVNPSPFATAPGFVATAWTLYGGDTIHTLPNICNDTAAPLGSDAFAHSLGILIHEASHARGLRSESCAQMTADIGVFDVLRRFYSVPFFSAMSWRVGDQVHALTLTLPPEYQPGACWRSGTPS